MSRIQNFLQIGDDFDRDKHYGQYCGLTGWSYPNA